MISKIYSNKPKIFEPIEFNNGLNVVLAEIRLPQNKHKDTHNLGKSILGRLLDFCFLSKRNPNTFLFKHYDLFKEFVFFLEIRLSDKSYVTLQRSIKKPSKISFKKHSENHQDFTSLAAAEWDHFELPFDRAQVMLDSLIDWGGLKPWSFRKSLGYQLRSQDDYQRVFQLSRFAGAHSEWKPFLAFILGFDSKLITQHYEKEDELDKQKSILSTLLQEIGGTVDEISKIEGILLLKRNEIEKKQKYLDDFDFRGHDKEKTKQLVDDINEQIALLNSRRYSLSQNKKKIFTALKEDRIFFDPTEAEKLFEEAGVHFKGQIKKDFQQLISFNDAITQERKVYLEEELGEIKEEISRISKDLNSLGLRRSESLSFLKETDVFSKYKSVTGDVVVLLADITSLERQKDLLYRLQELRSEIRVLIDELGSLKENIEKDVNEKNSDANSLFSNIRLFFSEIVEEVIGQQALLSVFVNKEGHLEFKAEILDASGNATSADLGHTYRKLLCIGFDLALLRAHLDNKFPQFVYHDGVFESLDDRKKENILEVFRRYSQYGIQPIITVIDTDLPPRIGTDLPVFDPSEIVLNLHDENEQGRLFKMTTW